jgi:cytochrome c oxidase assembly factor 2
MPPHLHPRSRSTTSLFAATLFASFLIVGMPHIFPCPAPRRTLADSETPMNPDGQSIRRLRAKKKKDTDASEEPSAMSGISSNISQVADEEVSTFLQMEEEAEKMAKIGRACPVPKPGGIVGELLGFRNRDNDRRERQSNASSPDTHHQRDEK